MIRTKEEAKLVAKTASLNLSVEQYMTKKRKAEGISSPTKSPKKAKDNDVDDATPSSRPHAVTRTTQPSSEGTPISRSSSGMESNKPVPAGEGREAEVKDAEGTASEERLGLRNKKNADYKAAPPLKRIRAGSPPKRSEQLGKSVPAKTAMKGPGRGEKSPVQREPSPSPRRTPSVTSWVTSSSPALRCGGEMFRRFR